MGFRFCLCTKICLSKTRPRCAAGTRSPGLLSAAAAPRPGFPLPAASRVSLESTRGLALIWIQIRLRPPAARDECAPLPGLYSRLLLAGVAPIKSRKLLPGIKWQEQGSQGQAPGFIKKSFTSAFQLSQSEPEKYLFIYGNIWGKKRNTGSRLLGGSAVQMCCLQGLGQFQTLLHSKKNLSEGLSSRSSPWIYCYFSFFFFKLVIENNVKTRLSDNVSERFTGL